MSPLAAAQIRRGIRLAHKHLAEIAAGRPVKGFAWMIDAPARMVEAYDRTMQKGLPR